MDRFLVLDQKTILYLGVIIGAATKGNPDSFVRTAAENIFDRVYDRENVEMPIEDHPEPTHYKKNLDSGGLVMEHAKDDGEESSGAAFIHRNTSDEVEYLDPRNTVYHYMQLVLSQRRALWERMGIVVPRVGEKGRTDSNGLPMPIDMSDMERDKFFFVEVKKQGRVKEMADLVEELRKG